MAVKDMWGKIEHPTINDKGFGICYVSFIHIRSQDIAKFAFELSDGLSLIHTAGMFGWIGY